MHQWYWMWKDCTHCASVLRTVCVLASCSNVNWTQDDQVLNLAWIIWQHAHITQSLGHGWCSAIVTECLSMSGVRYPLPREMKHVAEWPATATGCCYVACLCSFCSFIFVNDVCTPAVALKEDSTAVQLARSAVNRPVSLANNLWTSLSDKLHRDIVFLARKNSMEPGRYLGVCQKLIGNRQTSSYENSFWVVSLWRCCNLYGGEMRNIRPFVAASIQRARRLMESNSVLSWVAW